MLTQDLFIVLGFSGVCGEGHFPLCNQNLHIQLFTNLAHLSLGSRGGYSSQARISHKHSDSLCKANRQKRRCHQVILMTSFTHGLSKKTKKSHLA